MNAYELWQLQKAQEAQQNNNNYFRGWARQELNNGLKRAAQEVFTNNIAPKIANGAVGAITNNLSSPLVSNVANTIGGDVASNVAGNLASKFSGITGAGGSLGSGALAGGPLGAAIAVGLMALNGTNRKRAKSASNSLMNNTNQMSEQGAGQAAALSSADQDTQNLVAQNMVKSLQPLQLDTTPQKEYNPMTDQPSYLQGKGYPNDVNYNSYSEPQQGQVAENKEKQGFLDNVINGIIDFSRGYQENANNAFRPENLNAKTFELNNDSFKQSINPEDYRTKLNADEQTQFNNWVDSMRQNGYIAKDDKFNDYDMQGYWKNEVLNNTDLANGNAQNHFTDKYKMPNHKTFSNESIYATGDNAKYAGYWDGDKFIAPQVEKNKMGRLGEAAGTISRALQKPGVQAALAGGISTALTGNPLYGVGMAYKFANNRANTNMYNKALKDQGIEANPGLFGNIGAGDFSALMMPQYKYAMNDINLARLQEMQAYHEMMNQYNKERLEADKEYKAEKLKIDKTKAENKGGRGGKGGNSSGAGNPPKYGNGFVIMEAPNGKRYKVPENQISRYKKAGGKIVG